MQQPSTSAKVVGYIVLMMGLACAFLLLLAMSFGAGRDYGVQIQRQEAVDAQVAEWTVDNTGKIGFRYKGK